MNVDDYNDYCRSLPATHHVVQWGGSHVWKVGPKVFAIAGWNKAKYPGVTFKVSPMAYEILRDAPGLRPAPYLASRGMKWIQNYAEPGLSDDQLKEYLADSHLIISLGLTKKLQKELALNQDEECRRHTKKGPHTASLF
ncbi:MAG: MmcQ/YjbR family DNA-binding protein [Magnetovibrio sp.]|nr:MmcQ/YjbR family DNA-binding protein [Magnetovibrio sp.]